MLRPVSDPARTLQELKETHAAFMALAAQFFREVAEQNGMPERNSREMEIILNRVRCYYNVSQAQLAGPSRMGRVAEARMMACYLARRVAGLGLLEIGQSVCRTRSTAQKAVKSMEDRITTDHTVATIAEQLRVACQAEIAKLAA